MFAEYEKLSKKDMEGAIKSEFSGDIKKSLLTVGACLTSLSSTGMLNVALVYYFLFAVRCIKDKPAYFAKKLHDAMDGLGTNDEVLARVIVTRVECDMVQIKEAFHRNYNESLAKWIEDDTSGDYKNLLLALVGDRPAPEVTAEEKLLEEEAKDVEEIEEEVVVEEGTLKPVSPFDAKKDCEALKKALKRFGKIEQLTAKVRLSLDIVQDDVFFCCSLQVPMTTSSLEY